MRRWSSVYRRWWRAAHRRRSLRRRWWSTSRRYRRNVSLRWCRPYRFIVLWQLGCRDLHRLRSGAGRCRLRLARGDGCLPGRDTRCRSCWSYASSYEHFAIVKRANRPRIDWMGCRRRPSTTGWLLYTSPRRVQHAPGKSSPGWMPVARHVGRIADHENPRRTCPMYGNRNDRTGVHWNNRYHIGWRYISVYRGATVPGVP